MKNIQQTIQAILDGLVARGAERGAQVAVYFRGEPVVDAVAGTVDATTGRPVASDTLFPVFSTTKGVAATVIHLLVERGKVSYETPLAEVWPGFAAHGKGGITLRHALNHTAGLPNMPTGLTHADLGDWDRMCAAVAGLKPVSPPGAEIVYHAITYGWLLGEVARRVDGRGFSQIMRDEICVPLGLMNEMFVGIPDSVEPRMAILEMEPEEAPKEIPPGDEVPQAIPPLVQPLHQWMNRPDARRACVPASNGIMTARAVARHYGALLPGGVDGIELLPPERIRLATEMQRANSQPADAPPSQRGLGYQLGNLLSTRSFGHDGYGGSTGFADPEHGLAVGFVRNRFTPENSFPLIAQALKQAFAA